MKKPSEFLKFSILALLITTISPLFVNAQSQSFTSFSDLGITERIELELTPEIPGANDEVDVFLKSYMFDVDKSTISWYVNGSLVQSNIGLKSFSFKTGNVGESTTLGVVVVKPNGETVEKSINIIPSEIDFLVEPETYTPPFYMGAAIPTYQTNLKLIALPTFTDYNGNKVPDSQIVYTWKINGDVKQSSSGVGRNVYIHETNVVSRPLEVYLTASPINSDQAASVFRIVDYTQPKILIYENNPVFGTIFGNAIDGDFLLSRQEIKFDAVPLFFDLGVIGDNYEWKVNGDNVSNQNESSITFRRVDNNPGTADIAVSVRNEDDKILQSARSYFSLIFEEGNDFEF